MKYKLPDFDLTPFPKVYAGDRLRYATATSTSFIDDDKILVGSFLNKKIYLINIKDGFEIINEISTEYYPDLMDYKNNIIITSNRSHNDKKVAGISIFNLNDDKISHIKTLPIDKFKELHGCRIIDDKNLIVTETSDKFRGVYFVNIENGIFKIFKDFEYFPKDIFLFDDKILVITSHSRPSGLGKVDITNSYVYLYDYKTLNKIDELFFYGQTDAICYKDKNGFITLQGQDSLLHFKIENNKFEQVKLIEGFNFPHGIAYDGKKIVVTNYGDNSIEIFSKSDLIDN